DNFVFLPSVLGFANNSLSMLFSFDTENRETNEVRFIPSVLGVFLTLSICGYLVSLKKRNDHISSKVEEKTRAYHELNSDLEREIEKKGSLYKQLNDSAEGLRILTNSVSGVIWEADPREMAYIYISNQVEKILGYSSNDYLSGKRQLGGERVKEGTTPISTLLQRNFVGPDSFTLEYEVHRQDGQLIWIRNVISKIFKDKVLVKIRGVFFDITEEKNLEGQRELIEGKLKHAQKMESIGQLAAGIAHEINTPSQFVGDNLSFISDSTKNLINYHKKLEHMIIKLQESELTNQANNAKLQLDIDFLEEEIPQAIEQSVDGVSRITEIVSAMKDFSHPGKDDKQTTDINRAIESTTIVARNEWKYLADMQFDFSGDVLMVNCFPGEINQVILNMIANACYAIKDSTEGKVKGNILITTSEENGNAIIKIKDDGAGIREDIIEKVFDPFFTTKEVGQGTGQGLSLAYNIIVEKHGGKVFVESALGNGTTFTIQVPI
ncbi:MAG: PAS domain S-box-containing protein, partial [Oleiphilaceae bacterium]